MTAILIGTGPCWTLSHEDESEWRGHYDTELAALMHLASLINLSIDLERNRPGPRPAQSATEIMAAEDLAYLIESTAEREPAQCARIRCNGCGVEADWDEGTTSGVGDHFLIDQLDVLRDYGWQSSGAWDSCPECPVPEQVVRAHEEAQARQPGPNDVPLFIVPDPGGGS